MCTGEEMVECVCIYIHVHVIVCDVDVLWSLVASVLKTRSFFLSTLNWEWYASSLIFFGHNTESLLCKICWNQHTVSSSINVESFKVHEVGLD